MSRYSDKVHQAQCARCDEIASTLKLIRGKPEWVCLACAKEQK